MSWIHRDDLVSLILEAIHNPQYRGVYNATAPKPVRMGELCNVLGARGAEGGGEAGVVVGEDGHAPGVVMAVRW